MWRFFDFVDVVEVEGPTTQEIRNISKKSADDKKVSCEVYL